MDKYEFSIKMDELKRLAANGQFRKAGRVLETIELKKIKNPKEMYVVIDILIENERYDQARELLVGISKKIKSRRIIHQLIDVSIKSGQMDSAKKYMREFHKMAPNDPYNYVFQYQMAQFLGESYEKQIEILENLKQYEYLEKWAYELAKTYHRAGRDADCIAECDDLILWFGEGLFVEKAKLLRQYLIDEVMPSQLAEGQDLQKNCEIRSVFTPIAKREEPVKTQLDEEMEEESEETEQEKSEETGQKESEETEQEKSEETELEKSEETGQKESEETEQDESEETGQKESEETGKEQSEEIDQEESEEAEQDELQETRQGDLEEATKEEFGKRRKAKNQSILGGVLSRFMNPKESGPSDCSQSLMDEESVAEDELPLDEPRVASQEIDTTSKREFRESERPLYQSAFDFIEDMELREQEEELDRIIEAANRKKEQQVLEENRENGVQEGSEEQAQDVEESWAEGAPGDGTQELQEMWAKGDPEEGDPEVQEVWTEEEPEERTQEEQESWAEGVLEDGAQEVRENQTGGAPGDGAQELQDIWDRRDPEERDREIQEGGTEEVPDGHIQEVDEVHGVGEEQNKDYNEEEEHLGSQTESDQLLEAEEEHAIANDQEVKELVEEMSSLIAEQIEELFFQETETAVEEEGFNGVTMNLEKVEKEELSTGDSCDSENYLNKMKQSVLSESIENYESQRGSEEQVEYEAQDKSQVMAEDQQECETQYEIERQAESETKNGLDLQADSEDHTEFESQMELGEQKESTNSEDFVEESESATPEGFAEENESAIPEGFTEESESATPEGFVEESESADLESFAEENEPADLEGSTQKGELVILQTFNGENTHEDPQDYEDQNNQNKQQETETQTDPEQLQTAMQDAFTKVHKTHGLESKEAVLEDVDKLIKKRRQRATTKKLNEFVKERIGKEAEVKDYLGQFAQIHSVGEDILRSVENISVAHNSNITMFVCGENTFDETYFARRLAKLFYALSFIESKKLIVLNYEKFLALNFDPHIEQIQGGCIIVEGVMESSERMRGQIQKLHENRCVVMLGVNVSQDEKRDIVQIKEELQLAGTTENIWLETLDVEELMGFAEEFLEEKEYTIEEDAKKYFINYIEEVVKNRDSDTFCKVLEKISKAYHCANQRNKVELRNIAELGNYQDAAFMSIKHTDFANEN